MMPVRQCREACREPGGPSRREEPTAGAQCGGRDVEARLLALEGLTTADLQIEWKRLYRATPPTRLSRDLLIRGVAYRVQECAFGGLSLSTRRRLRSQSATSDRRGGPAAIPVVLKPGAKLVREWHGRVHTVVVLDDGFEYQGQSYRSLTRIAHQITGAHWSGPVFFGIKRQPSLRSPGPPNE
jgi:Protein of unknown function (DUF2924)